jgi:prohibitin 2
MSGGFPRNFADLQRTLQNAQEQGRRFGGGRGNPRNALGGLLGLVLLGGGAVLISNSLFNGLFLLADSRRRVRGLMEIVVDGGHRAIKYTRISGVKKEIYNEGVLSFSLKSAQLMGRNGEDG